MTSTGQISLTDCVYIPSIQQNVFLVLCLGIWWRHEIRISKLLNFDFLENENNFLSEIKNIFPSFTKAFF